MDNSEQIIGFFDKQEDWYFLFNEQSSKNKRKRNGGTKKAG